MKVVVLASILFASGPLRWLPTGFERAVWLDSEPAVVYTDLGAFEYRDGGWARLPSETDHPFVRTVFSGRAAMLNEELVLPDQSASLLLTDGGSRLLIVQKQHPAPRMVRLPTKPEAARILRVFRGTGSDWWVQGVSVMGDAVAGVFLFRMNASRNQVVRSAPREGFLPAFAGSVTHGALTWLIPEQASISAEIWGRDEKGWKVLPPPKEGAFLFDAMVDAEGTLWGAYSAGLLRVTPERRGFSSLVVNVERPVVLCGPYEGGQVRGRWKLGERVLGWGVGERQPSQSYPMNPQSCPFLTNASASRALVADHSVSISLTSEASLPVAE